MTSTLPASSTLRGRSASAAPRLAEPRTSAAPPEAPWQPAAAVAWALSTICACVLLGEPADLSSADADCVSLR